MPHGWGTYTRRDGGMYKGQWVDDHPHGLGEEISPASVISFVGYFRMGLKHGVGRFVGTDESIYEGEFRDNAVHGTGTCKWTDGMIYNGQWKRNLKEGAGTLSSPDGSVFEGEFANDQKHGKGKSLTSLQDLILHLSLCAFSGVLFKRDGSQYNEEWMNGQLLGSLLKEIGEKTPGGRQKKLKYWW